jgi:hypothetical protein
MKMKQTVAMAIGAAALALTASHAGATLVTAQDSDLLLCFEATGSPGSTINLEIDLGNYASPLTSLNIETDLVNTYGSTWYDRSNLVWGVVGTAAGSTPSDELFVGSADSAGHGTASPFPGASSSGQAPASTDITNGYSLFNGGDATPGSTTSGGVTRSVTVDNTTAGSFGDIAIVNGAPLANLYDASGVPFTQTADLGSTSGSDVMDLYSMLPEITGAHGVVTTPAVITDFNYVTLNGNGTVTVGAVPEPSTWASIILGAATLIGLRRRRVA